ncbi:hypothetical protein JOQ06_014512, partial [Pogonophryne albipinna]
MASGLSDIDAMVSGNLSCLLKTTCSSQVGRLGGNGVVVSRRRLHVYKWIS